jgi:hypothetical protein
MVVRCGYSEGRIQAECVREYDAERDIWGLRGIRYEGTKAYYIMRYVLYFSRNIIQSSN